MKMNQAPSVGAQMSAIVDIYRILNASAQVILCGVTLVHELLEASLKVYPTLLPDEHFSVTTNPKTCQIPRNFIVMCSNLSKVNVAGQTINMIFQQWITSNLNNPDWKTRQAMWDILRLHLHNLKIDKSVFSQEQHPLLRKFAREVVQRWFPNDLGLIQQLLNESESTFENLFINNSFHLHDEQLLVLFKKKIRNSNDVLRVFQHGVPEFITDDEDNTLAVCKQLFRLFPNLNEQAKTRVIDLIPEIIPIADETQWSDFSFFFTFLKQLYAHNDKVSIQRISHQFLADLFMMTSDQPEWINATLAFSHSQIASLMSCLKRDYDDYLERGTLTTMAVIRYRNKLLESSTAFEVLDAYDRDYEEEYRDYSDFVSEILKVEENPRILLMAMYPFPGVVSSIFEPDFHDWEYEDEDEDELVKLPEPLVKKLHLIIGEYFEILLHNSNFSEFLEIREFSHLLPYDVVLEGNYVRPPKRLNEALTCSWLEHETILLDSSIVSRLNEICSWLFTPRKPENRIRDLTLQITGEGNLLPIMNSLVNILAYNSPLIRGLNIVWTSTVDLDDSAIYSLSSVLVNLKYLRKLKIFVRGASLSNESLSMLGESVGQNRSIFDFELFGATFTKQQIENMARLLSGSISIMNFRMRDPASTEPLDCETKFQNNRNLIQRMLNDQSRTQQTKSAAKVVPYQD